MAIHIKKHALAVVSKNGMKLANVSKKLLNDKEVVLAAVRQYGCAVRHTKFTSDIEVMTVAVEQDGTAFYYGTPSIRGNKDLALMALSKDKEMFKYILPDLQKDKDIRIAAGLEEISSKMKDENMEVEKTSEVFLNTKKNNISKTTDYSSNYMEEDLGIDK